MVDRDDLRRQHGGVPVGHPRDERAEPHTRGLTREPREQRPPLERWPLRIGVERLEVIEDPDAFEAGVLGEPSARNDLVPRELMLRDVQAEPHAVPSRSTNRTIADVARWPRRLSRPTEADQRSG